jgi:hypothetical protein
MDEERGESLGCVIVELAGDATTFFLRGLECRLAEGAELRALRLVPDHSDHEVPVTRLPRAQTDLHGKATSVLPLANQNEPRAHRSRSRLGLKAGPMPLMSCARGFRDQNLHRFTDQLLGGVSELHQRARVDFDDETLVIDNDDPVGRRLEHRSIVERHARLRRLY